MAAWRDFVSGGENRIQAASQIGDYFRKLTALSDAPKLEDIWQRIAQQRDKLAKDSLKLWEYWLRLAPARLSAHDRHLLGEFAAVLRLLVQSDEASQRVGGRVSILQALSVLGEHAVLLGGNVTFDQGAGAPRTRLL
jgi:hypothetical protein